MDDNLYHLLRNLIEPFFVTTAVFGLAYLFVYSPKRKAIAEVYKEQKLLELKQKQLESTEDEGAVAMLAKNLEEVNGRLKHIESENQRLLEENQFLKRIADK